MADLSNKSIALLLMVAVVVSLGGTMISLNKMSDLGITGRAGDNLSSGYSNFSITSSLSIKFNDNAIDFGAGYVNGSFNSCSMGTNDTSPARANSGCVSFVAPANNLTIENDGNLVANVSMNFSKNATGFIGGALATPRFRYQVTQYTEGSSCGTIKNGSTFKEVILVPEQQLLGARICNNLGFDNSNDLIEVAIWIEIPQDAAQNEHIVNIWALGCNDASC